uniref:Uncharacterized protein n=1 Tax=Heterorhabditis bacteriophora TaxID=37862 RepID=A0A1I7XN48_HETBA
MPLFATSMKLLKMIYQPFSVLILMVFIFSITEQQKPFQRRLNRYIFNENGDQLASWNAGRRKPRLSNLSETKEIISDVSSRETKPMNNYGSILSGSMSKDLVKQISDYLYTLLKSPDVPRSSVSTNKRRTTKQYHHTNTVEEFSSEEDYETEHSIKDEQITKEPGIFQSVPVKKSPLRVIRNRALGVSRSIMISEESRLKDDPISKKRLYNGRSKRVEGRS